MMAVIFTSSVIIRPKHSQPQPAMLRPSHPAPPQIQSPLPLSSSTGKVIHPLRLVRMQARVLA